MPKSSSRHLPHTPDTLVDMIQHDLGRGLIADTDQGLRLDLSRLTPDEIGLLDRLEAHIRAPRRADESHARVAVRIRLPDRLSAIRALIRATHLEPHNREER